MDSCSLLSDSYLLIIGLVLTHGGGGTHNLHPADSNDLYDSFLILERPQFGKTQTSLFPSYLFHYIGTIRGRSSISLARIGNASISDFPISSLYRLAMAVHRGT